MAIEPLIFDGEPLINFGGPGNHPVVDENCDDCCTGRWCLWGVYKDVANAMAVGEVIIDGAATPHSGVYTNTGKWYLVKCGTNKDSTFVNSFPDFAVELPALGGETQTNSYNWSCPVWSSNNSVYIFSNEQPYVVKVTASGSVSWTVQIDDPANSPFTLLGPFTGNDSSVAIPTRLIIDGGTLVFSSSADFLVPDASGYDSEQLMTEGVPAYHLAECPGGVAGDYHCFNDPYRIVVEHYLDDSTGYIVNSFTERPPTGTFVTVDAGTLGAFAAPGIPVYTEFKAGTTQFDTETVYTVQVIFTDCAYLEDTDCVQIMIDDEQRWLGYCVDPTNQVTSVTNTTNWDSDSNGIEKRAQDLVLIGPLTDLSAGLVRRIYSIYKDMDAGAGQDWESQGGYHEDEILGGPGDTYYNGKDPADGTTVFDDDYPYVITHKTARGETLVLAPHTKGNNDAGMYLDGTLVATCVNLPFPSGCLDALGTQPQRGIVLVDSSDVTIYCGDQWGFPPFPSFFGAIDYEGNQVAGCSPIYPYVRKGHGLIKLSSQRATPEMYEDV